jgi:hypothetical protein
METGQIVLDAGVTCLAEQNGRIAVSDKLGRVHVFEAEEFMRERR